MRVALNDAAPFYRDTPEAKDAKASGGHTIWAFIKEVLPRTSEETCTFTANLIISTLRAVEKLLSETPQTPREIEMFADAMASMFCAYLKALARSPATRRTS